MDFDHVMTGCSVEEYSALRGEISSRIQRKFRLTASYVGLCLAIDAFAVKEEAPELFLLSPLIVAVALLLLFLEDRRIRLVATYLRAVYESGSTGPKWETALNGLRDGATHTHPKRSFFALLEWFLGRGLIPMTLISIAVYGWFDRGGDEALGAAGNIIMAASLLFSFVCMKRSSVAYSGRKLIPVHREWAEKFAFDDRYVVGGGPVRP